MHQFTPPSDAGWEYRDLVIPLNLSLNGASYPTRQQLEAFQGCDGIVAGFLGQAAGEGWEAAEPADWDSLAAAGRFVTDLAANADESGGGALSYTAVTIRLKRLARPDRPSGPVQGAAEVER